MRLDCSLSRYSRVVCRVIHRWIRIRQDNHWQTEWRTNKVYFVQIAVFREKR